MPRGDRRGPDGLGPMTGRGLGYCAGYDSPGFTKGVARGGAGFGYGRGFGRGMGRGFGWRNQYLYSPYPVTPAYNKEQELTILNSQVADLTASLDSINKRIEELKNGE
ncbi:MAG: DUF5320 domain-containing protein [Candidatus Marinimicrobia bacterium]|nr:DUF5320 domain-containing protein [Candidatus Neomarinimicrobiota bacterium]